MCTQRTGNKYAAYFDIRVFVAIPWRLGRFNGKTLTLGLSPSCLLCDLRPPRQLYEPRFSHLVPLNHVVPRALAVRFVAIVELMLPMQTLGSLRARRAQRQKKTTLLASRISPVTLVSYLFLTACE